MAPTVTFSPANGATGVPISNNITIIFSEAVRNIDNTMLTDSNSGDANGVGRLITLRLNNTYGTNIAFYATIDTNKTVITIDTTNNLPHSQVVYVAIGATVEDSAGNPITAANATFTTVVDNITISSSASDNASVAFGQSYQYQLATSGTYSGTITYSLSNQPDGMTISSSGLVEWTPTKASQITTHTNITITLTTASGYVLTQTYDLTVTGTCVAGNVLGLWSGDQRTSTDSTKYLGNISAYTDNASTRKTASENYNFSSSSANITFGPKAETGKGSVFFYHQYDNTTHLYFNYFFGEEGGTDTEWQNAYVDVFTSSNTSADDVVVADDSSSEFSRTSQTTTGSLFSSSYKGRFRWKGNTDGGVIGPLTGTDFKVYMHLKGTSTITSSDTLSLYNLTTMNYFSKDNSTVSLGDKDDFTVGYKASIDCSN